MEAATTTAKQSPIEGLRRFLGTRRGSFLVAAVAALFAAIFLIAYLNNYKDDVRGGTVPTQVLIADRLIPKGTAGDVVATDRLFRPATVTEDDAKAGALPDAAALSGTVAVQDIFPGQQITSADFTRGGDPLRGRLTGTQRALAIPTDQAHGLLGTVRAGDKVDVFGSFTGAGNGRGVLRTLAQGVLVLKAPGGGGEEGTASNDDKSVVLRLTDTQAARLAYASDNAKIWFALRPPAGVQQGDPAVVTQQNVGPRVAKLPSTGGEALGR